MIGEKQGNPGHVPGTVLGIEGIVIFVLITSGYRLLWSQMPVDDVDRYSGEVRANGYFWDLGHIWMQPVALWINRVFGDPANPVPALTWINTLSTSLGLAIFYWTLRSLLLPRLKCLLVVMFAAISFNFVSLGPTAHIKMLVLPFLALSLHFAVVWERDVCSGGASAGRMRDLLVAGAALGLGACFLVSMVPVIVGGWLFMIWRLSRSKLSWGSAFWSAMPFALAGGLAGLGGLVAAFLTGHATGTIDAGPAGFVLDGIKAKYEVSVYSSSLVSMVARMSFSVLYNFIYLQYLGQYGRAYMDGFIPSLEPFAGLIAIDLAFAIPVIVIVGIAIWFALESGLRRNMPSLVALGFGVGGLVYAFLFNLNDPEHWFQLTMPVLIGLAVAVPARSFAIVAAVALPAMAIANVAVYAYPRVVYSLEENAKDLHSRLGPYGLLVNYAGYPGNMTTIMLPGVPPEKTIRPDIIFASLNYNAKATLAAIDEQLKSAIDAGHPVIIFRIMDDTDWRGPTALMAQHGLSPARLRQHLRENYVVTPAGDIAGFPAWLLSAR